MTTLSVPDMTCGHCKASVEAALATLPGASGVTVDLSGHRVTVTGPAPAPAIIAALAEIGFPAEIVTPA